MPQMIPCQRDMFEIPEDLVYLNCAYISPQMKAIREVGIKALELKAHPWTVKPQDFYATADQLRATFAKLIGTQAQNIALIPSVSYGVGIAAANLKFTKGQEILVLQDQFPSNVYPWMELARTQEGYVHQVPRPENGDWTSAVLERMNQKTGIVAIPNCHWTDGSTIDLVEVGKQCQEMQVPLVIDASQSLGAMPLALDEIRPAFLVTAGYKWLMGPYSVGYLYVDPQYHGGRPLEHNWITRLGSEDFSRLVHYTEHLTQDASRFDMGERSNFALLPMAIKALELLLEWGVENIAHTLRQYNDAIARGVQELGFVIPPRAHSSPHMQGLRFPGKLPSTLAASLAAQHIFVSVRGDAIRVAPHLYNNDQDLARFLEALSQEIKN